MPAELVHIEYKVFTRCTSDGASIMAQYRNVSRPVDVLDVTVHLGNDGKPYNDYVVRIYSQTTEQIIYQHPEGHVGIIEEVQRFLGEMNRLVGCVHYTHYGCLATDYFGFIRMARMASVDSVSMANV